MAITRSITIGSKKKKSKAKKEEKLFKRKTDPKGKRMVVVESPAKAKTIERILGSDYKVFASMGHLRDLPERRLGVDVEDRFKPEYVNSKERADVIAKLQKEANHAKDVLLATDPDREGEAISWHLSCLLDVNPKENVRIAFHEITAPAIREAVNHPAPIDLNRVDAQQARRVLDRLVGYKLSPWLWKQVYRGLSAGRVQSVATRLICDREEEIRAFRAEEYWTVEGTYATSKGDQFSAKLVQINGEEAALKNEKEAAEAVSGILGKPADISAVTKSKKQRKAKPPFTTSTLQQDAVNQLNFGSKKTMMLAQILYEGVELPGHGHVGLITYMRTDSVRISDEMIRDVRLYIGNIYGAEYVPAKPNVYAKGKKAQDAHEAIRPTNLAFSPESLQSVLTKDQLRLYALIWNRFLASQMAAQIQETVSATLSCGIYALRATGTRTLFDGFTAVRKEKEKKEESAVLLPSLSKGETVINKKAEKEQHFTSPPARYTEASLIKVLEEKGIGRPSTYAPILDTVQKRAYVEKEGKQFIPTEIGFKVTHLLKDHFAEIVSVDFTAKLEVWLDKIADGKTSYEKVLTDFYRVFREELELADTEAEKEPDEVSDVVCEKCGAKMIVKWGRYGKYLACPSYPNCRNIKPYGKEGVQEEEPSDTLCPDCGTAMVYRTGPYGRYLKCPKCGKNKAITEDTGVTCPKCGKGTFIRKRTRRGRFFYGCSAYPQCDMALWNEPVAQRCEACGSVMVKKIYKNGTEVIVCSNPDCPTVPPRKKKGKGEETA